MTFYHTCGNITSVNPKQKMATPELVRLDPSEAKELYEAEHFLPAVKVDNEVEWVNPNVDLPFDLVTGLPTELALMVLPDDSDMEADAMVLGISGHQRSIQIGRQPFSDAQGVTYRDIDSKGSGYVEWNPAKSEPGGSQRGLVGTGFNGDYWGDHANNPRGLLDIHNARRDQVFGEIFSEGGVRVALPLAVIRLKEIIDKDGEKIGIDEARHRGILDEDFDPAIELRGFGTRHRLNNWGIFGQEMSREGLNDAIGLVANEIGLKPEEFTPKDYLLWFARTLGEQLRKIHEMGFAHAGLHSQNLTLDCRLVDLDTVQSLASDGEERDRLIDAEGPRSYLMVSQLRQSVAYYYPDLKKDNQLDNQLDEDELDELDNEIKRVYEEGYRGITGS